jgi:Holliday junction resolvasome RuvABC DNA-binding subunit
MTQAPLFSLAPMLKTSPDELVTRLQDLGYKTTSADDTLDKIAASANEQPLNILLKLLPVRPQ